MYKRFHGVDKHSTHLTITIVDAKSQIVKRILRCIKFDEYIKTLNSEDAVAIEAGNQTFHIADKMEEQGAYVIIVNPMQFNLISKSTKKTDKNDSEILARCLLQSMNIESPFSLPSVYKPQKKIRELRRLFSSLQVINKTVVQFKNASIGMLRDSGVDNSYINRKVLFDEELYIPYLNSLGVSSATKASLVPQIKMILALNQQKIVLKKNIIVEGSWLSEKVELLLSIKGVSPLLALGFLADVGDLSRFKNIRSLNSYLGLVPMIRESGKSTFMGHIIKKSRYLTRTLFTQGAPHIRKSSESLQNWYSSLKERRGTCRSRIALIRKTVNIMRRMILDKTIYHDVETSLYEAKLHKYRRLISKKEVIMANVS